MIKLEVSSDTTELLLESLECLPQEHKSTKTYIDIQTALLKVQAYWATQRRAVPTNSKLLERPHPERVITAQDRAKSQERQGINIPKKMPHLNPRSM